MKRIELVGQMITCTNYATSRLFDFSPEQIRAGAEHFLACGISRIEIPKGVLDPANRARETGVARETVARTVAGIPAETRVIASYMSGPSIDDVPGGVARLKREFDAFLEFFPHFNYTMLHPHKKELTPDQVARLVDGYAEFAAYARRATRTFQVCYHNHFDTSSETADQVCAYLDAIRKVNHPGLRWGPDTGHCHGMREAYLDVFRENADLIGDYFHIKARVPAFDKLHGDGQYRADRDIWGNAAEIGRGLYGGFVNAADPEIETPFRDVFEIIRNKPTGENGDTVYGAMEIDIPRQHPRLEVLCTVLYMKNVHGITPALDYDYAQIVDNVFEPVRRCDPVLLPAG